MLNLLTASLLMASLMAEPSPCDDVLDKAKALTEQEDQLSLLGGCLASPNDVFVHAPVVIEMTRISNENGMPAEVDRYLDILASMIKVLHYESIESEQTKNRAQP